MEPNMIRTINSTERRERAEAIARRMRAEQFDRLIVVPLARALALLRHLPASVASRAWSARPSTCD